MNESHQITIFPDEGEPIIGMGHELCTVECWETPSSGVKLYATLCLLEGQQYAARVIEKNLSHPRSGVCHSPARSSMAPLEVQRAYSAGSMAEILSKLQKAYRQSGIKPLIEAEMKRPKGQGAKLAGVIKSAYVCTDGDSSVGLSGEQATVTAEGDFLLDLNEVEEGGRREVVETFRAKLKDAFEYIWDGRVSVRFDNEMGD